MSTFYAPSSPEISTREKEHMEKVRILATQGMVLLKNNGVLPLDQKIKTIALYGSGARRTVKGGTGSGDVNSRSTVSVEQGLENCGYQITTKDWLNRYDTLVMDANKKYREEAQKKLQNGLNIVEVFIESPFREPDVPLVTELDIDKSETNAAIYVLSRNSGEGADRHNRPGDYQLSEHEEIILTALGKRYKTLIVLLNVGGQIDAAKLNSIAGIDAILLMSQAGNISGDAVADILTGRVTPSAKLTATWAANYSDYPSSAEYSHNNGNLDDAWYEEGIFVGYRYFDTFNITPIYEFGYGQSYTSFSVSTQEVKVNADRITVSVNVTNTGMKYCGKEVVQIYISAPEGKLEKPFQELIAYAKTHELSPGEAETMQITFQTSLMASYSEDLGAWVLEEGIYVVRVGTSSRNTAIVAKILLDQMVIVEQLQTMFDAESGIDKLSRRGIQPFTYESEEIELARAPIFSICASEINCKKAVYRGDYGAISKPAIEEKITLTDVMNGKHTLDELIGQLSIIEMATLCVGTGMESMFGESSVIGAASLAVPGAAGETTSKLCNERDIKNMVLADGPAGLRLTSEFGLDKEGNIIKTTRTPQLFELSGQTKDTEPKEIVSMHYQYCTAIPIATLLAQSWDTEVLEQAGDIVGSEMEEFGITLWLAPGMNIQRNPLCGRNFEYYSEDPLVSGMCASAMTLGVQQHNGVGTTIKHYAGNNQEDNRYNCNNHMSERTLREIYLRGFELCIKSAQPMSIMTSYNLINGVHTANRYDLLTNVARDEWGFEGVVMTDWGTTGLDFPGVTRQEHKYPDATAAGCIAAGNDLIMPGSKSDIENIVASVDKVDKVICPITLADLQFTVKRILTVLMRSNRYEGAMSYDAQYMHEHPIEVFRC